MGFLGLGRNKRKASRRVQPNKFAKSSFSSEDSELVGVVVEHLPALMQDLVETEQTADHCPLQALRTLFALSEHDHDNNRVNIVRQDQGTLVPTLLTYLAKCPPKSSEQYLTLLVLNNLCIPPQNKRLIAIQHGGAKLLAGILCNDPSCHLSAIVLVNLTFADVELRSELLAETASSGLVESLAFALRVASLTNEELHARQEFIERLAQENLPPKDKLSMLMAEDQRLRPGCERFDGGAALLAHEVVMNPACQAYAETARWCLSAIKNLTRPVNDESVAEVLVTSGIYTLILEYIMRLPKRSSGRLDTMDDAPSTSSESTAMADPFDLGNNTPGTWDSSSMQDAALFVVFNLASCPLSRDHVFERETLNTLSMIASSGSQGHFGQSKLTSRASTVHANPLDSPLIMSESDITLLMELLQNTFAQKGKDGPGGYSASTFTFSRVLFALRCLLTHTDNQGRMAAFAYQTLNTFLVQVIAAYSLEGISSIDAETAEDAVFCLYLMSNHGFDQPFLPEMYSSEETVGLLVAKILVAYKDAPATSDLGLHAAEQILLRLTFLQFATDDRPVVAFPEKLLAKAENVDVGTLKSGATPNPEIFHRPILRARKPKRGVNTRGGPWENKHGVSLFANALQAVQQLSFGSIKVRHVDDIDDIKIANMIADSANGEKTQSYNFLWAWEDKASEISRHLEQKMSGESRAGTLFRGVSARFRRSGQRSTPFVSFLQCGSLCTVDDTLDEDY
eukprot:Nitzschia sp. Nitz4//scaffold30_size153850//84539//87009//NITZ4_002782-RA/size153850-augustus-gene-0.60-mRNA-1//1//CDS//3329547276//5863//frame0